MLVLDQDPPAREPDGLVLAEGPGGRLKAYMRNSLNDTTNNESSTTIILIIGIGILLQLNHT